MSTHIEHGKSIFGLSQGPSVLWRDVGFVAAESNTGSVADGEGETKGHELPRVNDGQSLVEADWDMAHPCDDDCIVVIAHSFHHPDAGDEPNYDGGSGDAEECYYDSKHSWPTILHRQCSWVGHECVPPLVLLGLTEYCRGVSGMSRVFRSIFSAS